MAPDFVHQQSTFRGDEQSDIFSFGVCLYQVLTGRLPFLALGDNPQIAYFQRWYATDKLPEVEYRHPVFRVLNRAGSCIGKCLAFKRMSAIDPSKRSS
jgi:serine/threonine protein kinase